MSAFHSPDSAASAVPHSVDRCPEWLVHLLEIVQTTADLVGLFAISIALLVAAARWFIHEVRQLTRRNATRDRWLAVREIRLALGSYILFGLEFMIVSDIIHSFLQPDLPSLTRLGLLVLIRTLISFFLGKELEGVRHEEERPTPA